MVTAATVDRELRLAPGQPGPGPLFPRYADGRRSDPAAQFRDGPP